MSTTRSRMICIAAAMASVFLFAGSMAADLNPAALAYKLPKDIKWVDQGNGAMQAVMAGDPSKPALSR